MKQCCIANTIKCIYFKILLEFKIRLISNVGQLVCRIYHKEQLFQINNFYSTICSYFMFAKLSRINVTRQIVNYRKHIEKQKKKKDFKDIYLYSLFSTAVLTLYTVFLFCRLNTVFLFYLFL